MSDLPRDEHTANHYGLSDHRDGNGHRNAVLAQVLQAWESPGRAREQHRRHGRHGQGVAPQNAHVPLLGPPSPRPAIATVSAITMMGAMPK